MPTLDHVLETALYVDDLDRAAAFYADVFQLPSLHADERLRAFAVGPSVLLLFRRGASLATMTLPGGTIPAARRQRPPARRFCHRRRPTRPMGGAAARSRHCDRGPHRLAARRPQHLFPRPRRTPAGTRDARAVAQLLTGQTVPQRHPNREPIACWRLGLKRDDSSSNRHPALGYCWSMIFSENRYPLFGIMLL
jgi:catechol 2,3-dioxygenase-like lactoylglutathione lyase family enzyme